MAEADVQSILDALASDLGAAVSLEDVDFRLLAHTAHGDVIDEARRSMIIGRRSTAEVRAWFEQWDIRRANGPIRTPADPAVGVGFPRWCVPVRLRDTLLGYIWVLDTRGIDETELEPAVEASRPLAAVLYQRRLLNEVDTDLLRLLLIPNPDSDALGEEARDLGAYAHEGPVAVVVAGVANEEELTDAMRSDLALATRRAAEQVNPESVLAGLISGFGVLLAPLRAVDDLAPARRLAQNLVRAAERVNSDLELNAGIGGATELAHATRSYAEARRTLRMIRAMPDLGPIAEWDGLGVFRALGFLPVDQVSEGALDPRVRELLHDSTLAPTAELFLDLAGDVQGTAARLYIHRTTLYQRLDRIAALYKLDLRRSGDHRLLAHLGFKLARLARGRGAFVGSPPDIAQRL